MKDEKTKPFPPMVTASFRIEREHLKTLKRLGRTKYRGKTGAAIRDILVAAIKKMDTERAG